MGSSGPTTRFPYQWSQGLGQSLELTRGGKEGDGGGSGKGKQDDYKIDEAIECGQKFFGENRVQEAFLRWHERIKIYKELELRLIGPLQTNKVKQALKIFDYIHSLDSIKLAKKISDEQRKMFDRRNGMNESYGGSKWIETVPFLFIAYFSDGQEIELQVNKEFENVGELWNVGNFGES